MPAPSYFPIEWGHILQFARALGDTHPDYLDPRTAVAPPTFVMASAHFDDDYPLRPKPGQPWPPAPDTPEPGGTELHAEQHFEYHRPLRPGDVLSAVRRAGATWEKTGRRSGRMHFWEQITEYFDQDGELVVVARSVGVRTGRAGQ